jgi:hypothetical protein
MQNRITIVEESPSVTTLPASAYELGTFAYSALLGRPLLCSRLLSPLPSSLNSEHFWVDLHDGVGMLTVKGRILPPGTTIKVKVGRHD